MHIEKYLNTTKEEVETRTHNIWIGVSLGNKYWTKEHVQIFVEWALKYTKQEVLVVIGDSIHSINLEVLDNRTPQAALKKALRIGEERYQELSEMLAMLPSEQQAKIRLIRWDESSSSLTFQKRLADIKDEYQTNPKFREYILEIVRAGRKDRASTIAKLSPEKMDRLAEYILNELPHFVDGVQGADGMVYTLIPYPGLTKLDELFIGLQNKTLFPELAQKLNITNNIAIVEAYAE